MKKYLMAGLLAFVAFSCRHHSSIDCSAVYCAPVNSYQFTLTDNNTGANLLSGPAPRYTINDIGLFTEAGGKGSAILFGGDTTDNVVSVKTSVNSTGSFYIRIKNSKDYKLSLVYQAVGCCGWEINVVKLDEKALCFSCTGITNVPIE